ncbi:mono/diheme cytochrome c family protein [Erwinia toletana]|uniref:Mono/diheme cytochrome c family protein n=1 Tax=Winslowiella toletana TaxID=92490 RepID=A0ABS4PCA3_9GAMM|nr:cytochrome c [Winslowiella toletana]MBP2170264.1 mono/diheme cytochrome c family protein [Winslowiella toletana]
MSLSSLPLVAGVLLYQNGNTAADNVADNHILMSQPLTAADADAVKRGHYIAVAGDCVACHTAPESKNAFAGGYAISTPFGGIYASNITPDSETGIGNWTERDFYRAVRHGKGKQGENLYPAMPYNAYIKVSDEDMHDLWMYMRSVKPVRSAVPETSLPFPYNIRLAMMGWNLLFFDNQGFTAGAAKSAEWNRGAYLVEGLEHCAACHNSDGKGIPNLAASLADNPAIMAPDASSLITTVLQGGRGAVTHGNPTSGAMPGFAWKLSDQQAAAVATYIRNSWGNAAPAVTAEQVAEKRKLLKLPARMPEDAAP